MFIQFMQEKTFLCEVAFEALVEDMPDFIGLLVDHGLDLRQFVTAERLERLYHKVIVGILFFWIISFPFIDNFVRFGCLSILFGYFVCLNCVQ